MDQHAFDQLMKLIQGEGQDNMSQATTWQELMMFGLIQ